jgi:hypothetical protein
VIPRLGQFLLQRGSGAAKLADSGVFFVPPFEDSGCGCGLPGDLWPDWISLIPNHRGRRQSITAKIGLDTVSSIGYRYDTYGRLESVTEPGIGTNGFAAVFGHVTSFDLPHAKRARQVTPKPQGVSLWRKISAGACGRKTLRSTVPRGLLAERSCISRCRVADGKIFRACHRNALSDRSVRAWMARRGPAEGGRPKRGG